jgi:hypothetical protein
MLNVDFFQISLFFVHKIYNGWNYAKKSNKQQQKWEKIWDYFCQHT